MKSLNEMNYAFAAVAKNIKNVMALTNKSPCTNPVRALLSYIYFSARIVFE